MKRERERERKKEKERRGADTYIHTERRIDSRYGYNKGVEREGRKRRERERERNREVHGVQSGARAEREGSLFLVCVRRAREPSVGSCCTLGPDTAPTLHRASPSWTLVEFVEFRATNENRENAIYRPARTNVLEWMLYKRWEASWLASPDGFYASFLKIILGFFYLLSYIAV